MNRKLILSLAIGLGALVVLVTVATNYPQDYRKIAPTRDQLGEVPGGKLAQSNLAVSKKSDDQNGITPQVAMDNELLAVGLSNVESGVEFIKSHYQKKDQQRALSYFLSRAGKLDLSSIGKLAPEISDSQLRSFALGTVAEFWVKSDSSKAISFADKKLQGVLKNEFFSAIVNSLNLNGRSSEASKVIEKIPFSDARSSAINQTAMALASKDPSSALRWTSQLPLPEDVIGSQTFLTMQLASEKNFQGLSDVANEASTQSVKDYALTEMGKISGREGESFSLPAVIKKDEHNLSRWLGGAVQTAQLADLPKLGAEIANIRDRGNSIDVVRAYVGRMFAIEPSQAIQWVSDCAPAQREDAIRSLVTKWYDTDSLTLSDWINQMRSGSDRDFALDALANRMINSDRNGAAEIAAQISDRRLRTALEVRLGKFGK